MKLTTIPAGDITLSAAVIAPQNPSAVVVLVHGMAEHKDRYYPFMEYLAARGFACVIADQRGHGATASAPEDLGYFGPHGVDLLVKDCAQVIGWARAQYPGLKLFLFGHSMGSMVVRCTLKAHAALLDGLVVCGSPSPNPVAGLGIALTRLIGLFKGDRFRSKRVAMIMFGPHEKRFHVQGMHNAWLSANMDNVKAYNEDKLCGFKFTLNGYRTVMQLILETYSKKGWIMDKPSLPIHFIAGEEDPCIESAPVFDKAVDFLRSRGYTRVSSKLYTGMRHEILNETEREMVWQDVNAVLQSWL